jgi:hypothetical protein
MLPSCEWEDDKKHLLWALGLATPMTATGREAAVPGSDLNSLTAMTAAPTTLA